MKIQLFRRCLSYWIHFTVHRTYIRENNLRASRKVFHDRLFFDTGFFLFILLIFKHFSNPFKRELSRPSEDISPTPVKIAKISSPDKMLDDKKAIVNSEALEFGRKYGQKENFCVNSEHNNIILVLFFFFRMTFANWTNSILLDSLHFFFEKANFDLALLGYPKSSCCFFFLDLELLHIHATLICKISSFFHFQKRYMI